MLMQWPEPTVRGVVLSNARKVRETTHLWTHAQLARKFCNSRWVLDVEPVGADNAAVPMTEEYRISPASQSLFPQFEIKGYFLNMISAPPYTDPVLGRFPSLLLFDNEKCNPAGRIHGVAYFHPDRSSLGLPEFRDNVIYLHYLHSMLEPLLSCLRSSQRLTCYFRGGGTGDFGGIQGGPFARPLR